MDEFLEKLQVSLKISPFWWADTSLPWQKVYNTFQCNTIRWQAPWQCLYNTFQYCIPMQYNTLASTLAMLAALISLPSLVAGCLSNVARIAVNLKIEQCQHHLNKQ